MLRLLPLLAASLAAPLAASMLLAACAGMGQAVADRCAPAEGLEFICGTGAVEDLAPIAGTNWLVGGNLAVGALAQLRLIDSSALTVEAIAPDFAMPAAPLGDCAAPPDPARWSISGLAADDRHLYVTNHGDRMAVEIFAIDRTAGRPSLRWAGCVAMPAASLPNALAPDGAGGFHVLSFHDPADGDAFARMDRGEPTGSLWHWTPLGGLVRVDAGPLVGGNGLAAAPDGRQLFISAWGARQIVVLDLSSGARGSGARRTIALPFMPDNLHFAADGSLLVAGQRGSPAAIGACGVRCPQEWIVARLDPQSGEVTTLLEGGGSAIVDYAVGAVEAGGRIWITLRGDDRIGVLPQGE